MKIETQEITSRIGHISLDDAISISKAINTYLEMAWSDYGELTDYQHHYEPKSLKVKNELKDMKENTILESINDLMSYFNNHKAIDSLISSLECYKTDTVKDLANEIEKDMEELYYKESAKRFHKIFLEKSETREIKKTFYTNNTNTDQKLLDIAWEKEYKKMVSNIDEDLNTEIDKEVEKYMNSDKKHKKNSKKIIDKIFKEDGLDSKTLKLIKNLNNSNIDKILVA